MSGPGPWSGMVGEDGRPGTKLPSVTGSRTSQSARSSRCSCGGSAWRRCPTRAPGCPTRAGVLVGSLVHAVLERIVADRLGRRGDRLDELADAEPVTVPWPDDERLEAMVAQAAESLARRHGLVSLGMAPLLAAQAQPYLAVARPSSGVLAAAWPASSASRSAVRWPWTGGPSHSRFRADRVDRGETGLSMVDYKTGGPPSKAKGEDTRYEHLLREVARGNALQGVAYALAAPGSAAEGRYLYLKPELGDAPDQARDVRIASDDAELAVAFARAVRPSPRCGGRAPCSPESQSQTAKTDEVASSAA